MRVLIIVTDSDYGLLASKVGWLQDNPNDAWSIHIKQDLIVIVSQFKLQPREEDTDEERRKERAETTQRVVDATRKFLPGPQVAFLAYHSGSVNLSLVKSQIEGLLFRATASFSHETDSEEPVYPALCALVANPTAVTFDSAVDAVVAKQGKSRADRIGSLQHRILRLFVPPIADWQNCHVIDSEDEMLARVTLSFRKVVERLDLAWALFYDAETNNDNLERVVKESGLTKGDTWHRAKSLLPRSFPQSESERDQSHLFCRVFFEDESLGPKDKGNSRIQLFTSWCGLLDETLSDLRNEVLKREK